MAEFLRKEPCPKCKELGNDKSGDNLAVYDDGSYHCFACGNTKPSEAWIAEHGDSKYFEKEYPSVGLEFNDNVHAGLKKETTLDSHWYRGIDPKISRFFAVRYALNEDGAVRQVLYPTTKDYNIAGYKSRIHPKNFAAPYGEVGKDCEMFGQFRFKTHSGICVIVGGEHDQLAAYQMLSTMQKDKKYDTVAVVSSTVGETAAYKQAQTNYDFFFQFKKIYICMDSDEAGRVSAEKLAEVLPKGRVHIMKMRRKDPNAYLYNKDTGDCHDFTNEFVSDFWAAKPYVPEGVKSASESFDEIEEELLKPRITLPPYMHKMQVMMGGGMIQGRIMNIIADTSVGKCFSKGTLVLMFDGSTKRIEEIGVGEEVMGADGQARVVLTTTSGVDEMFRVDQVDGVSYEVNSHHILSLRAGYDCKGSGVMKGDVVNINVLDYMNSGAKLKRSLKGYKANLSKLGENEIVDFPYLLGLWLADGSSDASRITIGNKDVELKEFLKDFCSQRGWGLTVPPSCDRDGSQGFTISGGFRTFLSSNNLIGNKHIPEKYKFSSERDRMQLLAGLVDGDGFVSNNCIELTQKSDVLRDDIIFLARSLGLRISYKTEVKKCQNFDGDLYHRMVISGDVDKLPVKLPRRKIVKSETRRNLNTAITVTPIGEGEYFGFSIDGDHLFCLSDFTVTHNSTHVNRMVYHWIFNSPEVPTIVSLEATAGQYMLEMLAIHMRENLRWVYSDAELITFLKSEEGIAMKNELCFKEDGSPRFFLIDDRNGDIKDMEKQVEKLFKQYDSKLFVFDVLTNMLEGSSAEHIDDHMHFQRNMVKNGVTFVNVLHTRKPPNAGDGPPRKASEYDAKNSGTFVQSAAYNIVMNRNKLSDDPLVQNKTEVDMPKCRGGKTGNAGNWFYDFMKAECHDFEDYIRENPEVLVKTPNF